MANNSIRKFIVLFLVICICCLGCSSQSGTSRDSEGKAERNYEKKENGYVTETNRYASDADAEGKETVITWVVFQARNADEIERDVNKKLEEDGYTFRLNVEVYDDIKTYNEYVKSCDADIVYTGLTYGGDEKTYRCPAYFAIQEGAYLNLGKYLENSRLKEFIPAGLWETVKYDGEIYCVPNGTTPCECSRILLFKKDRYTESEVEAFDGSPEAFERMLGADGILAADPDVWGSEMLYSGGKACSYGYYEGGYVKNIMELDDHVEWIRLMHKLNNEKRLYPFGDLFENDEVDWSIAETHNTPEEDFSEGKYYVKAYKQMYADHMSASIAIRSESRNPGKAFSLMELIMTDREYGNLVAFGSGCEEIDGYAVDREDGSIPYSYPARYCFGICTGIWKSNDEYVFDSSSEWKKFVEENAYFLENHMQRYPEQLDQLMKLYGTYEDIIYEDDEKFEFGLKKLIQKSKEIFDTLPDGGKIE